MTNAQRKQLADEATSTVVILQAQLAAVKAADDTLRALLGANADLSCTLTNAIASARKVTELPTAGAQRELDSSMAHLEAFARRRMRIAIAKITAMLPALTAACARVATLATKEQS